MNKYFDTQTDEITTVDPELTRPTPWSPITPITLALEVFRLEKARTGQEGGDVSILVELLKGYRNPAVSEVVKPAGETIKDELDYKFGVDANFDRIGHGALKAVLNTAMTNVAMTENYTNWPPPDASLVITTNLPVAVRKVGAPARINARCE
jgi:hypothetical protein